MSNILHFVLVYALFVGVVESTRHRRQYSGYGPLQPYVPQYGSYGTANQGWMNTNNMHNNYANQPGYNWNHNFQLNQANRRPEWYFNTANNVRLSMFCIANFIANILLV